MPECTINFQWESEAAVWMTTNDSTPSFLESGFIDALIERVHFTVSEAKRRKESLSRSERCEQIGKKVREVFEAK